MTQQGQSAPRTRSRSGSHPQASASPARGRTPGADGGQVPSADTRGLTDALGAPAVDKKSDSTSAPALKMEEAVVAAGRNGERNLSLLWVDVWIGNSKPCRFDVTTLPGHTIEIVVEQAAYRRVYTGSGTVSTQPVPVAPRGTKITATATDLMTGETAEQRGVWYEGDVSLWQRIKRLIWKG